MIVFDWKSNPPPKDVCVCDYHPRPKMNGLLSLLLHRDMGLVFRCVPCEWKTPNTTLYILKTSLNGGSGTVLVNHPLPSHTKASLDWEASNDLEAGAEGNI